MVKETYIYKRLNRLIDIELELTDNLDSIADWLYKDYGVKIYFCQIIGERRWSFLAGFTGVIAKDKRVKIENNLGMVIENYSNIAQSKWKIIIEFIEGLN